MTGGPSPAAAVPPRVPWTEARTLALALLDEPGPLLVIADFDGTLAPITRDPLATRIDPLAREWRSGASRASPRRGPSSSRPSSSRGGRPAMWRVGCVPAACATSAITGSRAAHYRGAGGRSGWRSTSRPNSSTRSPRRMRWATPSRGRSARRPGSSSSGRVRRSRSTSARRRTRSGRASRCSLRWPQRGRRAVARDSSGSRGGWWSGCHPSAPARALPPSDCWRTATGCRDRVRG